MTPERIVVTGLGVVSALGSDLERFFAALLDGRCGASPVARFTAEGLRQNTAAVVVRPPVLAELEVEERDLPWAAAMGIVAARHAIDDAGLSAALPERTPLAAGCSIGAPVAIERDGVAWKDLDPTDPLSLGRYSQGTIVAEIAARLGLCGPVCCLTTTCAAGNYAIGAALDSLRHGAAEIALAGGVEELSTLPYAAFHQIRALSSHCRPFDARRDGILFGEGAAFLVLETAAHAARRGAKVYAEVLAVGYANDAYNLVAPDPEGRGAALAIERALTEAGVKSREVDYVNAHGTGTPLNDPAESKALARVFGADVRSLPVSSTKGATGHTMAAASALEAVVTVLALGRGTLPPTAGLEQPDPSVTFDALRGAPRARPVAVALSNGFGFGGNNAVLAVARPGRAVPPTVTRHVYVGGGAALVGDLLGLDAVLAQAAARTSLTSLSGLDHSRDAAISVPAPLGGGDSGVGVGSADAAAARESVEDASGLATFAPAALLGKKGLRHVDRGAILLAAALEHDLARWPSCAPDRAGAVIGSAYPAYGSVMAILRDCQAGGASLVNPMLVPFATANCAPSWWLIRRGITGFNGSVGSGECAGLDAILFAATQVAAARIDTAVAGGVEAHTPELWAGRRRLYPSRRAPLAEGAAVVVLGAERAAAWARVAGCGAAFRARDGVAAQSDAVRLALADARCAAVDLTVAAQMDPGERDSKVIGADILGDTLAVSGALATLLAAAWLRTRKQPGACALVTARSALGYGSALVLAAVPDAGDAV
ncbi:MAG: hypothetical protein HY903_06840 [Deltaproteobacteria bacterium]|nr:hypothetical protein [Deltaproteobacteria bacterium]